MIRNIESLKAQARSKHKHSPLVLPPTFRDLLPFDPGTSGWPLALHMPDGMGMVTVRFWDEIGVPAVNETSP
jgi:hypothetical protein